MLKNVKNQLRADIAQRLREVSNEEAERQSRVVFEKIVASEVYQKCQRVSIYVSTDGEVQTDQIIRHALLNRKEVFIPQFVKKQKTMSMVKLKSLEEFKSLPATLWGIRQPDPKWNWEKYQTTGSLDLVLTPGVAFTTNGCRCGHGMGYYDKFFHEHRELFARFPIKIGLALSQQIVGDVPCNESDVMMDQVVFDDHQQSSEV